MLVRRFTDVGPADLAEAGGKGANLGELTRAGAPVPPGFVMTTEAYRDFVATNDLQQRIVDLARGGEGGAEQIAALFSAGSVPETVREQVLSAYAALGAGPVAVRSSATAEDLAEASFAGQQETFLNVRGESALLTAVRDCWASLWTARAIAYRARQGIDPAEVALAVVIQEMVDATAAGVMFTANPLTGRRHETVISAAWGLGEQVVSGSVNTDNVVVAGGSVTREDEAAGHEAVLTEPQALTLAELGAAIAAHFGVPQDIEWALAGDGTFHIVQSRAITALPDPIGPAPTRWPKPAGWDVCMRGSIVEQMPDPLSPLFAGLAERYVVPGMLATIKDFADGAPLPFSDTDFGFPIVNGYAYYGYNNDLFLKLPKAMTMAWPVLRGTSKQAGTKAWAERFHPAYAAAARGWKQRLDAGPATGPELLEGIKELTGAGFAYYTSVQTVIPATVTAETLFSAFYRKLIKKPGDPSPEIFLLGFESTPIRAEQSLYDLGAWTAAQPGLAAIVSQLNELPEQTPADVDERVWAQWRTRFAQHLDRFGHAVYNLDIMSPVAADDPAPLLDSLRFYLRGEGQDPRERRNRLVAQREQAVARITGRLSGWRRRRFESLLAKAQDLAPVREDALADMGLAWPTVRRCALELGFRLVDRGVLAEPAQVFWLQLDELTELAGALDAPGTAPEGGASLPEIGKGLTERVAARQETWRGQRTVTPPAIVPDRSVWHIFDSMMPNVMHAQTGPVLRGMGASGGRVTAPARVVRGPADFSTMRPGDVLVAAITTPAWTPLFTIASAVVTDVGGPLSHSSIVAREYGIPAVLGTTVATSRITTGDLITVDGEAGTVTLPHDEAAEPAPRTAVRRWVRPLAGAGIVAASVGLLAMCRRRRISSAL